MINIYTDGACSGNPGPGGYGIVMLSGQHRKELSQGFTRTTNNRMELMSVSVALEQIKNEGANVTVYSDSKYVVEAFNKNWIAGWIKKNWKDVKNPDLWQRLLPLCKMHNVTFVWVKGHASNVENNRCDQLAVNATRSNDMLNDDNYTG
jgi:ribonuclease HI